jgi:antiviral helicase SKI2
LKRPVPLEHFIYTGHDGKSREELFLIMNKEGQLLNHGYNKATEAKAKLNRPPDLRFQQQQSRGGGPQRNPQQSSKGAKFQNYQLQAAVARATGQVQKKSNYAVDRSVYSNLTEYLRTRSYLPCVIFVFSRKRCDDSANMMFGTDLTTKTEKSEIVRFFHKCIDRLQGSDKGLPQVITSS